MPIIPVDPSTVPFYDWQEELGDVPEIAIPRTGQHHQSHPIRRAFQLGGDYEKRAIEVLSKALELAEGRIGTAAAMLDCHYLTAFKLVHKANLGDLAGQLRFQHRHRGPTGFGKQPRLKRKPKARAA